MFIFIRPWFSLIKIWLTGAKELQQCRAARDFQISQCPCDQVIHIRSALVGHNEEWERSVGHRRCLLNETTCTRIITNESAIRNCHGRSTCWIPTDVLDYPPSDKLCDRHQTGNFIHILYDCVNSGNRKYWLQTFVFYFLHSYIYYEC